MKPSSHTTTSFPVKHNRLRSLAAFTLLELMLVISIIAILASLLMPAIGTMRQKADSIACASNLRTIGVASQLYLQDHSYIYPCIQNPVDPPIYPPGIPTQSMLQAFGPYGVTAKTLQCPSDLKQGKGSSYALYQNSYDWKPTLDDESPNEPLVYGRGGRGFTQASGAGGAPPAFVAKLTKIRQVFDDTQIHFGHMNALYADGHVVAFSSATTH